MVDKAAPMKSVQMAHLAEEALDDLKAINVVTMDVSELTDVMDYMVIASGSSSRHVKSLASNVSVELKKQGIHVIGIEGEKTGDWVLVDLGDVVVHVMLPDVRDLYDLERLWTAHSSQRDTRSVQSEELD
jgi:ribosome-associated protein